jgi:glycosyltransferase involved in cell wall biosynthesis
MSLCRQEPIAGSDSGPTVNRRPLNQDSIRTERKRPKLAVFFSHPTQHHSAMFQYLARAKDIDLHVYYYDPGSLGGMFDPGYRTDVSWDVDLTRGTDARVLTNLFRGREVHPFRQVNPGVVTAMLRGTFDAVMLSGYASPSNWLVLTLAQVTRSAVLYQSDTNVLDIRRRPTSLLKDSLRKIFLRGVTHFLVAGDQNREAYRQLGIEDGKMVWCPIPVDVARYNEARGNPNLADKLQTLREKYGIPKTARVVAFCGKLIERKRPQDLIEALRIVGRKDTYGLLIGSGEMEQALRKTLTPDDRIVITGFVNQSEIPYHMLLGDMGVVSSEWDPHPLVTTEFAMCGLPVIVSHYCGVWGEHDILRPGENGFLYDCGDVPQLATQISQLLEDDELRLQMGQQSLLISELQSAEYAAKVVADLLTRSN